jgi:hypothetical protein
VIRRFLEVSLAYRLSREAWDPKQAGLGQDRRVFHRIPLRVDCKLANPAFGLESSGQTVDVSLEGLGVVLPVNWSEGNRVRVQLDEIPFQAEGTIVFRKEDAPNFRYGVKFQKTGLFQLIRLRRFLQQHHSGKLSV